MNKDAIEKIFPVAAATSKVLHSGMTLTELYVEYTRLQEELQQQKAENTNLTQELKQIVAVRFFLSLNEKCVYLCNYVYVFYK